MVVNDNFYNYLPEEYAYNKQGLKKWYLDSEHLIKFRFFNKPTYNSYEEEQLKKMFSYQEIVKLIMEDIVDNINFDVPTKIGMEGYSYNSAFGPLVDLVTFGTLLRNELSKISKDIIIISPSTLKLETCKMTYDPIEIIKGKKKPKVIVEYRNNDGLAGGKFTKREMFLSVVDNKNWNDKWSIYLRSRKNEILEKKSVPKPIDDVTDAYLINKYICLI